MYSKTCSLGNISSRDRQLYEKFQQELTGAHLRNATVRTIILKPKDAVRFHADMAKGSDDEQAKILEMTRTTFVLTRNLGPSCRAEVNTVSGWFLVVTTDHAYVFFLRRVPRNGQVHEARGYRVKKKDDYLMLKDAFEQYWLDTTQSQIIHGNNHAEEFPDPQMNGIQDYINQCLENHTAATQNVKGVNN